MARVAMSFITDGPNYQNYFVYIIYLFNEIILIAVDFGY